MNSYSNSGRVKNLVNSFGNLEDSDKKRIIRIRFEWFEPWFNKQKNFFTKLLEDEGFKWEVISNNTGSVDLEFVSVYPPLKRDINARWHRLRTRFPVWQRDTTETYPLQYEPNTKNFKNRIWYTSENVRPPFQNNIDITLSFDQDTYGGKNFYLPLWYLHLDHYSKFGKALNPNSAVGKDIAEDNLLKTRKFTLESLNSRKFACVFLSNPQPTRLRIIEELSKYGQVDVFGLYAGKPVPNKYDVAKQYNFMVCPENDLYPGYVTEKLLDSYVCETVPLYWGDLGSDEHINRNSFLNLMNFESIEEFCFKVSTIKLKDYKKIYEQPFLIKKVSLTNLSRILAERL